MERKIKRTMAFISTKNDGDKLLIADAIEWADKTMLERMLNYLESEHPTWYEHFGEELRKAMED